MIAAADVQHIRQWQFYVTTPARTGLRDLRHRQSSKFCEMIELSQNVFGQFGSQAFNLPAQIGQVP